MVKPINSHRNISKIINRIKRAFYIFLIVILLLISFWGIVLIDNNSNFDSSVTNIYGTNIKYKFCCYDNKSNEFIKSEELVKEFMGDNYISPAGVVYVDILDDDDVLGFQENNRIYIQHNMSSDKTVRTIVHELLHLQNPVGFDVTINIEDEIIIGHNFSEAVIEKITSNLTSSPQTKRAKLLDEWVDSDIFIESFRNLETEEIWSQYFSQDDELYELKYENKTYKVKRYLVFLNQFDNWMIGI